MGLAIQIEVTGLDEQIERIEKFGQSLYMFDEAMETIGKSLTEYFSGQVFASQGGAIGENWPELSERYAEWKAVNYPGAGPLIRTGDMQDSFTYDSDSTSVTIGNVSDHFVYHQSDEPREVIPRRVMMAITDDVRTVVATIVNEDVDRKLKDAGLL